jgi:hypothetical protein
MAAARPKSLQVLHFCRRTGNGRSSGIRAGSIQTSEAGGRPRLLVQSTVALLFALLFLFAQGRLHIAGA